MCIWVCVPTEVRGIGFSPELELLQFLVSCPSWVLGTEWGSSARALYTLSPWSISPAPKVAVFKWGELSGASIFHTIHANVPPWACLVLFSLVSSSSQTHSAKLEVLLRLTWPWFLCLLALVAFMCLAPRTMSSHHGSAWPACDASHHTATEVEASAVFLSCLHA